MWFLAYTYQLILTTEQTTITIIHVKYALINGVCEDGGCIALTVCVKNVKAIKIVISKLSFSPDSGGKQNPRTDIDAEKDQAVEFTVWYVYIRI